MLRDGTVHCPCCGEPNEISVDLSGGARQSYTEDCQVCCRPWKVEVRVHGGRVKVRVRAEDDVGGAE